ncbi:acyl-CoA dehydrogenase [Escherichia coli]|uniref:acyl-CoA dehydrogenase n=1 Tax=Escherichia coli TaxID=562 RepID=UPI0009005462|nr:acyl-CoA dehydrogenase [Escherichia coli]NTY84277.1 acyl-CoA dehydrogenase [Citrobacter werkmanii]EEV6029610.1 acyl-CoA dehydrogenase [Escherichia coli]EFH6081856.1 acyl-CoA dehydrogenase [Escherichia coli]EIY3940598.1 acyl-CoA dehydrogenase [Escherichia coli]MGR92080.1 acyl-CoA dehydrogenase [Escherichia coli]
MRRFCIFFIFVTGSSLANSLAFTKNNNVLSLSPGVDFAEFSINGSHSNTSSLCNIGGMAESVRAGEGQRNRWIYSDSSSACVAVISEMKDGAVNIMTRSCEQYCGVSGSIDGTYLLE